MSYRIVAIGDIHGRTTWNPILEKEWDNTDKFIFIGDYLDSFNILIMNQIKNLKEIAHEALSNPNKIDLLIGNHDFHYLDGIDETYSGFNALTKPHAQEILELLIRNNQLNICKVYDGVLYSHAGISNKFIDELQNTLPKELNVDLKSDPEFINEIFRTKRKLFGFGQFAGNKPCDQYGNNTFQSPIWIRPESLMKNPLMKPQVFGHTRQDKNITLRKNNFALIDCLDVVNNYLVIENGKFKIETL